MAKQSPKLKLLSKDERVSQREMFSSADGLELITLEGLHVQERARIEKFLSEACPRAGLLAVFRGSLAWDIRPVTLIAEEPSPTVLRFCGPDLLLKPDLEQRLRNYFERTEKFQTLSSGLRDWGSFEGQLWYRREFVHETLAHQLAQPTFALSPLAVFDLLRQLSIALHEWHSYGIVHGHFSSSNIALRADGSVTLFDAGVLASSIQARGVEKDGSLGLAPEIYGNDSLLPPADIFNMGQVFRRLLLLLRKQVEFKPERRDIEALCQPYAPLIQSMIDLKSERRPDLHVVRSLLGELNLDKPKPGIIPPTKASSRPQAERQRKDDQHQTTGKIVKHETPASRKLQSPENVKTESSLRESWSINELPDSSPVRPEAPIRENERISVAESEGQSQNSAPKSPDTQTNLYQYMHEHRFNEAQQKAVEEKTPISAERAQASADSGRVEQQTKAILPEEAGEDFGPFDLYETKTKPKPKLKEVPLAAGSPQKENRIWIVLLFIGVLLMAAWAYRFFDSAPSFQVSRGLSELQLAWQSRIPSRMAEVAEQAIGEGSDRKLAEEIVLASIQGGDTLPATVDMAFLRTAFHPQWEVELTEDDRRFALALGLGGLLRGFDLAEVIPQAEVHPGIILGLAASGKGSAAVFLKDVQPGVLLRLPPPFGPAFHLLLKNEAPSSAGDEVIVLFSSLATKGVEKSQDIQRFFRDSQSSRLRALAMLYSQNNQLARRALDTILNHPNLVLSFPEVDWARKAEIINWNELEASDQLFVVAGMPPASALAVQNIGRLFRHPSAALRGYAAEQALDRIKFLHPATFNVLTRISKEPNLLTADQFFILGQILEDPKKLSQKSDKVIEQWLELKPSAEIVGMLLLGTAKESLATKLDTSLGVYLKSIGWAPDLVQLNQLMGHPDKYSRLFAYQKVFELEDSKNAALLLSGALKRETDPDFRSQLELLLSQLKQ